MRRAYLLLMILAPMRPLPAQTVGLTKIRVCMPSPADVRVSQARQIAALIMATAGVALEWSPSAHCAAGSIVITLQDNTPSAERPEWLAYALPYERTHITVFFDRVQSNVVPRQVPVVLGHVFAHEIVHILEGTGVHSPEGIMKLHWTAADYRKMECSQLRFTATDLDLIREGLVETRATRETTAYGRR